MMRFKVGLLPPPPLPPTLGKKNSQDNTDVDLAAASTTEGWEDF